MDVELRSVASEESTVASALFALEDVNGALKLGVRGDGFWLCQNHTAFDLFAIDTAQQDTGVVASHTLVELLVEHFNTSCNGRQRFVHQTNDFNGIVQFQSTAFDTTGHNSAAALNREDIFNRHEEVFLEITDWFLEEGVNSIHQVSDRFVFRSVGVCGGAVERDFGGTADDRYIIAGETVFGQQFADFHFDQLKQFGIVHLVSLVQEDQNGRNFNLVSQENVFVGLGHGTVRSTHNEDGAVNLRCTGDHVLDIVTVTGHINMSIMALCGLIFNMGNVDGNTAGFFFRSIVNSIVCTELTKATHSLDFGNSSGQGSFAMVNMTHRSDVHMWL